MPLIVGMLCCECGGTATGCVFLDAGRVLVDGKDAGQEYYYCERHLPAPGRANLPQPSNARHVRFRWSGTVEWDYRDGKYYPRQIIICARCGRLAERSVGARFCFACQKEKERAREREKRRQTRTRRS